MQPRPFPPGSRERRPFSERDAWFDALGLRERGQRMALRALQRRWGWSCHKLVGRRLRAFDAFLAVALRSHRWPVEGGDWRFLPPGRKDARPWSEADALWQAVHRAAMNQELGPTVRLSELFGWSVKTVRQWRTSLPERPHELLVQRMVAALTVNQPEPQLRPNWGERRATGTGSGAAICRQCNGGGVVAREISERTLWFLCKVCEASAGGRS